MKLTKYILAPCRKNKYTFKLQAPVAFLFAKILNADLDKIDQVKIYRRSTLRYIPFYSSRKGGGAITLGSLTWQSITFTENYFSNLTSIFGSKAYGDKPNHFLDLLSHELGHIKHAIRFKYLWYYLLRFTFEYIIYGHTNSPLEAEAEQYRIKYHLFTSFLKTSFKIDIGKSVFYNDSMSDDDKMKIIDHYWTIFTNGNVV